MEDRSLKFLIAEALALGGNSPCSLGHQWVSVAGRRCPHACPRNGDEGSGCSQAVYQCARCDTPDYGYVGGPGHADCVRYCGLSEQPAGAQEAVPCA